MGMEFFDPGVVCLAENSGYGLDTSVQYSTMAIKIQEFG
jgi:hypothetical protein